MSHKRDGSFNHYANNRPKQQKLYNSQTGSSTIPAHRPHGNGHATQTSSHNWDRKFSTNDNPALDYISRLPDPGKCEPCKLHAAELQTGMIALLEKLETDEMTPDGDKDVRHHAHELRRLLLAKADKSHVSTMQKKALNETWPAQEKYVSVPVYVTQKLEMAKSIPPLPPITEPHLEEAVFTHSSIHTRKPGLKAVSKNDLVDYERLEFLGDAYIELIATRLIHSRLPQLEVARSSHLRENLVKNETLGQFAKAYALPDRLKHGGHMPEAKAWTKIIADVFEAYVAGIVLSDPENGFKTAEDWLTKLWAPQLLAFKEDVQENAKARDEVQALIAMKGVDIVYREEKSMEMVDGLQKYSMGVYFTGWGYEDEWLGSGEGRNKKQAITLAAMDALRRYPNNPVMQAIAKKKQEMVQQRKEEAQRLTEAANASETVIASDEKKSDASKATTASSSDAPVSVDEKRKEKSASKPTSDSLSAMILSSLDKGKPKIQDATDTTKDSSSWLEKEKRKKEKKERKGKK